MNKLLLRYIVTKCERCVIRDFIEEWHYSHNINGITSDYCFKMEENSLLIGAVIFGRMAMAGQWKKYGEKESDITELRRLVCVDDTKRNAESYLIGRCLRWLRNNTSVKKVVSYADPEYGHQGTIYKATNFQFMGTTSAGRVIMWKGKRYHDKCIRTYHKGQLKPFAQQIKQALDSGEAEYKKTMGKNIYVIELIRKGRPCTL